MKIKNCKLKIESGLATLPTIIILSLVIVAIGTSMMTSGFIESLMSKAIIETQEAFYLADSGINDALLKIAQKKDTSKSWGLPTSGISEISVSGDATTRVIESTGIISGKQKKIKTTVTLDENGKITDTAWEEVTQ